MNVDKLNRVSGFDEAREKLFLIGDFNYSNQQNLLENTDRFIELLNQFPALMTDKNADKELCRLSEEIYSMKNLLPVEKQEKVTQIFRIIHHLKPTRIENLLEIIQPAKTLAAEYKNAEAVMPGNQEYPVPIALLSKEEMPCREYFKPLQVTLGDGTEVKISQGLLAHFSPLVKKIANMEGTASHHSVRLDKLNRHQFDSLVAFLETGKKALINEANALPLMYAAAYLQIPEIIEECKEYVYPHLDDTLKIEFLNLLEGEGNQSTISYLEKQISKTCKEALTQNPVSSDLLAKINDYKTKLTHPIRLSLSGSEISDHALKLLEGLPISELELISCPNLTKNCLLNIGKMPTLKSLQLGGNAWVNDEFLAVIPPNIETLSIATCKNFTGQGLANLQHTHVNSLDLFGCHHLNDEDFVRLPDQFENLNLAMCRKIKERTIDHLGTMSKLRHLNLSGDSNVNDHSLSSLSKDLLTLNLNGCSLSENAFKPLAEMKKLQNLTLSSTNIKGEGLPTLPLTLVQLRLDSCKQLTDTMIMPLADLEALRYLSLWRCPNINGDFLEAFSDKQIEIMW